MFPWTCTSRTTTSTDCSRRRSQARRPTNTISQLILASRFQPRTPTFGATCPSKSLKTAPSSRRTPIRRAWRRSFTDARSGNEGASGETGRLQPQARASTRSHNTEAPTATSPRHRSTRTLSPRWVFGSFEKRRRIRAREVSSEARQASQMLTQPLLPVPPRGRHLRRAGAGIP